MLNIVSPRSAAPDQIVRLSCCRKAAVAVDAKLANVAFETAREDLAWTAAARDSTGTFRMPYLRRVRPVSGKLFFPQTHRYRGRGPPISQLFHRGLRVRSENERIALLSAFFSVVAAAVMADAVAACRSPSRGSPICPCCFRASALSSPPFSLPMQRRCRPTTAILPTTMCL